MLPSKYFRHNIKNTKNARQVEFMQDFELIIPVRAKDHLEVSRRRSMSMEFFEYAYDKALYLRGCHGFEYPSLKATGTCNL